MGRNKQHGIRQALQGAAVVITFGGFGIWLVGLSLAASWNVNPTAYADYCQLENGSTVLYGWAYDPETSTADQPNVTVRVGNTTATLPSNREYRTPQVSAWIDTYYTGAPKSPPYGWRMVVNGIYKGGSYLVSGNVQNIGAGAATALQVNSGFDFSREPSGYKPIFTANSTVPDACMPDRPPTPAPAPAPAPTPAPTPAPRTSSGTSRSTTPAATPTPAPTPAPAGADSLSASSDASIALGSAGARFTIPAGSAAKIQVLYGANPVSPDKKSAEVNVADGQPVTIDISGLDAKQRYGFQLLRTAADGTTKASATSSFTTSGLDVRMRFVRGQTPVSGIKTSITSSATTSSSNKDGYATFFDVAPGKQTVTYTYNGKKQTETLQVTAPAAADTNVSTIASVSRSIDITRLGAPVQASGSKLVPIAVISLLVLLLLVAGIIYRRRRNRDPYALEDYGRQPLPEAVVPAVQPDEATSYDDTSATTAPTTRSLPLPPQAPPPPMPPQPTKQHAVQPLPEDGRPADIPLAPLGPEADPNAPEHMGESLRDMVIKAMKEERKNK